MNLYLRRSLPNHGHICRLANVDVIDAEGKVVGYVQPQVADWLIQKGIALDITPPVLPDYVIRAARRVVEQVEADPYEDMDPAVWATEASRLGDQR